MSNRNGRNGATSDQTAFKAAIIADMALKGATAEQMAATAQTIGYAIGAVKAQAATAAHAGPVPAWVEQARAELAPKPEKVAAGTETTERAQRPWEGPFDAGVSKAGYAQVMVRTRTKTGAWFTLQLPLDAYLAIKGGALVKPALS